MLCLFIKRLYANDACQSRVKLFPDPVVNSPEERLVALKGLAFSENVDLRNVHSH